MIESTSMQHAISEEILQAQERCNQILECKNQILFWREKLEVLEEEQADCIKLARLRVDAASTWKSLTRQERLQKKFILAALESPELPKDLMEYPSSASFPSHIRLDREILLARIRRDDFSRFVSKCQRLHSVSAAEDSPETALFLPKRLRADKEVILQIIPTYPYIIECMSTTLKDDGGILEKLLLHHPGNSIPPQFLAHFSERIRSSPKHVLGIVENHTTQGLAALAFAANSLRNDTEFAKKAIAKGSRNSETQVLRFFSQRLRADREVVQMAVCQSGLNLKYASYALRRDKEIVLAACHENGASFRYCLAGESRDELMEDKEFVHRIAAHAPAHILRICPDQYRNDRSVLLQATIHGLEWDMVPRKLDINFVRDVLKVEPSRYMDLSESWKADYEVAMSVIDSPDADDQSMLEAFESCPRLLTDRRALVSLLKHSNTDILLETLPFATPEIRGDKDIMLQAIKIEPEMYDYCVIDLVDDRDIVSAGLPAVLEMVDADFQMQNLDLVCAAIEKTPTSDFCMLYEEIWSGCWENKLVAKAWLSKGGEWLADVFPVEFSSDEELWEVTVKRNWAEFCHASESLRSNKQAVLKLLEIDARIIRDVDEDISHDHDIALLAFSKDMRALQSFSNATEFEFLVNFAQRIRKKLLDYSTYQSLVDSSIRGTLSSRDRQSSLGILNQGPETVAFYSSKIASYLDLPEKKELVMLQTASKNLLAWGI